MSSITKIVYFFLMVFVAVLGITMGLILILLDMIGLRKLANKLSRKMQCSGPKCNIRS